MVEVFHAETLLRIEKYESRVNAVELNSMPF